MIVAYDVNVLEQ